MRKSTLTFIPAITWLIISIILLTLPGSDIPSAKWLDVIWFDKWVHIGMFGLMVIFWGFALIKKSFSVSRSTKILFYISLFAIAYGIAMEFVQLYFIPGRSFDVLDMAADAIGAAIGFLFFRWRFIKK